MNRLLNVVLRTSAAILCLVAGVAVAGELKIAVASNFRVAMEPLVEAFEAGSDHEVIVSYGSTGKHYAQLINGAPFDLFLAADKERPARLEAAGRGVAGNRFTYALGTLVLWGSNPDFRADGKEALENPDLRFLAIANPRTAPYGLAAEQFLERIDLWEGLQSRIVRGESVSQAYAFVRSGNADMGLIALSLATHQPDDGDWYWPVPQHYYEPIEQQAIMLNGSEAALAFSDFLRGAAAREIISAHGYSVP